MTVLQTHTYGTLYITDLEGATYIDDDFDRVGYKYSPRPKVLEGLPPLYFSFERSKVRAHTSLTYPNGAKVTANNARPNSLYGTLRDWPSSSVLNKAYNKLTRELRGTTSQLGTTLAEWREAVEAIESRAKWLGQAFVTLRHGDFRKFLSQFSMRAKPKHRSLTRSASKDAGALWLEYWFGWAPLVSDIYAAFEVLNKPLIVDWVSIRGRSGMPVQTTSSYSSAGGAENWREWARGVIRGQVGGEFRMTNPNHVIASDLGLANPAAVLWELVPFSFMIDWFTNIGSYLNGWTDTFGYEIRNPYYSVVKDWRCDTLFTKGPYPWPDLEGASCSMESTNYFFTRVPGFYQPVITLNLPRGLSVTRGATAISLLVSLFLGDKHP